MYESPKYLTHDLLSLVKHFDLPLQQNPQLIAMNLDNQLDQQHLLQLNIHRSILVEEAIVVRIINLKLLSIDTN